MEQIQLIKWMLWATLGYVGLYNGILLLQFGGRYLAQHGMLTPLLTVLTIVLVGYVGYIHWVEWRARLAQEEAKRLAAEEARRLRRQREQGRFGPMWTAGYRAADFVVTHKVTTVVTCVAATTVGLIVRRK